MSGMEPVDPIEGHTAGSFDAALLDLRLQVVAMGGLVIDQVATALAALLEGDAALAELVLARELRVNELERAVDSEAFRLIALHQPMAVDLRLATAVSRITVDLERAGDESKKIAKFAIRLAQGAPRGPVRAVARYLRHMGELTTTMLREAVRALDESDTQMAQRVCARDSELDAEFAAALRLILTLVMEDQRFLGATIDTVFALKGLERIGDHAKNIAEQMLFIAGVGGLRYGEGGGPPS